MRPEAGESVSVASSVDAELRQAYAEIETDLESARFERDLVRRTNELLRREIRRLELELGTLEADRSALRIRLADRDHYFATLEAARSWRLFQFVRRTLLRRGP